MYSMTAISMVNKTVMITAISMAAVNRLITTCKLSSAIVGSVPFIRLEIRQSKNHVKKGSTIAPHQLGIPGKSPLCRRYCEGIPP